MVCVSEEPKGMDCVLGGQMICLCLRGTKGHGVCLRGTKGHGLCLGGTKGMDCLGGPKDWSVFQRNQSAWSVSWVTKGHGLCPGGGQIIGLCLGGTKGTVCVSEEPKGIDCVLGGPKDWSVSQRNQRAWYVSWGTKGHGLS